MGVDPNWGLLGGNNALSAFQTGAQLGSQVRERRERREYQNALLEQRKAEAQEKQQEQQRADIPMMSRLLEHAAKGPNEWQQARGVAQQYGIAMDNVPEAYDPAWAQQQAQTLKLLQTPEGKEVLSNAGKVAWDRGLRPGTDGQFEKFVDEAFKFESQKIITTQAGGAAGVYTPGQGYQPILGPNPGDKPFGAPMTGAPAAEDEWEVVGAQGPAVGGGGVGNGTGVFPSWP